MRKILSNLLLSALIFTTLFSANNLRVFGDEINLNKLCAKSVYVCDYFSNSVVYAKNETQRKTIASMTKIMLLLLAFEKEANGQFDFEKLITVSERASSMGGSQVFLQANAKYKAKDLIKSIIIASANDASVAIAEELYSSEECAVEKMNLKARQLGLNDTLFSNCTGLPKPTQYSSAKDVAIMLKHLLRYEKYFEFSSLFLDELTHPDGQKTTLTNTNKLIRFFEGCDGGKTGFTNESGYCLAATAKRGNMRVIAVLIDEPDSKTRFKECSELFNYSFNNFESKLILSSAQEHELKAKIVNGKQNLVEIVPKNDYFIFGKKNEDENIKIDLVLSSQKPLKAPVLKGQKVGVYKVFKNGVLICEVDAVAKNKVEKNGFFDVANQITVA